MTDPQGWRQSAAEGDDSVYRHTNSEPEAAPEYRTLTYQERADLDPRVHVIVLSGRGKGFCGGYDLVNSAEQLHDGGYGVHRGRHRL